MADKEIETCENTVVETEESAESAELEDKVETDDADTGITEETGKSDKDTTEKIALYYASVGVLVAMMSLIAVMFITVLLFPKNETVEVGSLPNYSYITDNPLWGDLCEVVTDVHSIDTSTVGKQTVIIRFFGFIDVKSRLTVVEAARQDTVDTSDVPSETAETESNADETEPAVETAPIETDAMESEPAETAQPEKEPKGRVVLNVENILQNPSLPNGCEVVSLAIVLRYMGYDLDPTWLFDYYMPKDLYSYAGNPWKEYVGNPRGYGFGCYAPCVVTTANEYIEDVGSTLVATDVSGMKLSDYEDYIDRGVPVIIWGTIYMNGNDHVHKSWYVDGELVQWYSNSHCLVMIGYSADTYIFCDPMCGIIEYSIESVEKSFELNLRQACVIEDKCPKEN